ncbi:hypothetical protein TorRG33x02_153640 [Trema orientale]|uniref:Endonuclease/exonuclease/phosphatase n=1 Tax=Trema orientale TaxID=63057 RepID=A0A2P5ETH3_TREOI|nr:hypothetical protein TorRG33x02_153640 [Trema orientale]
MDTSQETREWTTEPWLCVGDFNEILFDHEKLGGHQEGDRNAHFFHSKASSCKQRNKIHRLIDNEGRWCDEDHEIEGVVVDYFQSIFTSEKGNEEELDTVMETFRPCVTLEINEDLLRDFTEEDILEALKQMHPTKSPRPDGMSTFFY